MMHRFRGYVLLSAAALGVALCGPACFVPPLATAQDNPFDFGVEPAGPPAESAVEEAAAPPTAPAAVTAAPRQAAEAAPTLADYARRDPTVAAVLELPRNTPAEKLRAILALIQLGDVDVAALLTPELLQEQITDAERAALVREFGSAALFKIIRLDPPRPAGAAPGSPLAGLGEFAQRSLEAAAAVARDPARVAEIIARLNAPTPEERYAARIDLQEAGEVGVVAAFMALASADSADERRHLITALAAMRPLVDEPLLAVLADAEGQLARDAAELAGRLRLGEAVPWLSVLAVSAGNPEAAAMATSALAARGLPTPTVHEVAELLRKNLAEVPTEPVSVIDEGTVGVWWSWDPAAKQMVAKEFAPKQFRTLAAARWSRALADVSGLTDNADVRRVVIFELEEAALLGRPASPDVQGLIARMTPGELSFALGEALAADLRPASIVLAGEIAARGDTSALATSSGRPSPLAAALINPARDVRFAALSAVMKLAPAQSFPGSSYVTDSLWYFAASAGRPTAVTAAMDISRASGWAGELRAAGLDATPVRTGREAMLEAIAMDVSPRLAVIVLDGDIGQPLVGEVIYQLHTHPRTAGVPVLVPSSAERFEEVQRIAASDPLALVIPRPDQPGGLAARVEEARALAGQAFAPEEVRTEQAVQALRWIEQLLSTGGPYDELRRDAGLLNRTLITPELMTPTLAVLAGVGTKASQQSLVDFASARTLPLEARSEAAKAFAANVDRFGLRLGREQILQQYDRYNASETADAGTQQVLGQVLDVIERKPPAT